MIARSKIAANDPMRTAVRFPMRLALRVKMVDRILEATSDNISASGILFTGIEVPAVNTRIEFTIRMPAAVMGTAEDLSIHCVGRVIRHQQQGHETQAAAIIDEYTLRT